MPQKVVDLNLRKPIPRPLVSEDIWHGHIDLRLAQIERMIKRLEWQIWILLCGGCAAVAVTVLDRVVGQ